MSCGIIHMIFVAWETLHPLPRPWLPSYSREAHEPAGGAITVLCFGLVDHHRRSVASSLRPPCLSIQTKDVPAHNLGLAFSSTPTGTPSRCIHEFQSMQSDPAEHSFGNQPFCEGEIRTSRGRVLGTWTTVLGWRRVQAYDTEPG